MRHQSVPTCLTRVERSARCTCGRDTFPTTVFRSSWDVLDSLESLGTVVTHLSVMGTTIVKGR